MICQTCGLRRGLGFFTPSVIRKTSNSLPCTLVPIRETWIESEKYDLCVFQVLNLGNVRKVSLKLEKCFLQRFVGVVLPAQKCFLPNLHILFGH